MNKYKEEFKDNIYIRKGSSAGYFTYRETAFDTIGSGYIIAPTIKLNIRFGRDIILMFLNRNDYDVRLLEDNLNIEDKDFTARYNLLVSDNRLEVIEDSMIGGSYNANIELYRFMPEYICKLKGVNTLNDNMPIQPDKDLRLEKDGSSIKNIKRYAMPYTVEPLISSAYIYNLSNFYKTTKKIPFNLYKINNDMLLVFYDLNYKFGVLSPILNRLKEYIGNQYDGYVKTNGFVINDGSMMDYRVRVKIDKVGKSDYTALRLIDIERIGYSLL